MLDVATGTGLAAEAALALVGPTGYVTATDISPQMVERARERLKAAPNATVQIEDGQALGLPDGSYDAVICSLGLMFFPDSARGLGLFRTVLREGGRAAVSVNTVPERSYNTRIHPIIARYVPSPAADAARLFSLGNEQKLGALFAAAGFRDVKITTENTTSAWDRLTSTSTMSSEAGDRRARSSCRCRRKRDPLYARKFAAMSAMPVVRSRSRLSSCSPGGRNNCAQRPYLEANCDRSSTPAHDSAPAY